MPTRVEEGKALKKVQAGVEVPVMRQHAQPNKTFGADVAPTVVEDRRVVEQVVIRPLPKHMLNITVVSVAGDILYQADLDPNATLEKLARESAIALGKHCRLVSAAGDILETKFTLAAHNLADGSLLTAIAEHPLCGKTEFSRRSEECVKIENDTLYVKEDLVDLTLNGNLTFTYSQKFRTFPKMLIKYLVTETGFSPRCRPLYSITAAGTWKYDLKEDVIVLTGDTDGDEHLLDRAFTKFKIRRYNDLEQSLDHAMKDFGNFNLEIKTNELLSEWDSHSLRSYACF